MISTKYDFSCYLLKMKLLISTKYDLIATYYDDNWLISTNFIFSRLLSIEDEIVDINQIWLSCYLLKMIIGWYQPISSSVDNYLLKMKLLISTIIILNWYLLKMIIGWYQPNMIISSYLLKMKLLISTISSSVGCQLLKIIGWY